MIVFSKRRRLQRAELNIADKQWAQRLIGRYGKHAKTMMAEATDAESLPIENTAFCLAECRWAARNESVVHLDDLMLRRTRLGSILENGGESLFPAIEQICAQELNWMPSFGKVNWRVTETSGEHAITCRAHNSRSGTTP